MHTDGVKKFLSEKLIKKKNLMDWILAINPWDAYATEVKNGKKEKEKEMAHISNEQIWQPQVLAQK